MKFSIVIPARNEEAYIVPCLESICRAARPYPGQVEIIVVLNRCTDATERIALEYGARIARDDSKNLSRIRNTGARAAAGGIIVTIDADSRMSDNMLVKIDEALSSGKYIGGGVLVTPERRSLGIIMTEIVLWVSLFLSGLAGGSYWCYRADFEAIGGFDENMLTAEDLDFARRLKKHGRRQGKRLTTLLTAHIITSCRKFDRFGDWFMLKMLFLHPRVAVDAHRGVDEALANKYFYDFKR